LAFVEGPTAKAASRIAATRPRGKNLFIKAPSEKAKYPKQAFYSND
jgi:hypothetical protein